VACNTRVRHALGDLHAIPAAALVLRPSPKVDVVHSFLMEKMIPSLDALDELLLSRSTREVIWRESAPFGLGGARMPSHYIAEHVALNVREVIASLHQIWLDCGSSLERVH
jgi:hypothetical protein